MPNELPKKDPSSYKVIFMIIAAIVLVALVLVVFFYTRADDTGQTTVVGNASPTVDTVTSAITTGGADQATITPTENTTKTLYFHGAATDNNGCDDFDTAADWSMKLYRTDKTSGCSADNNDCYAGSTDDLTISGCTGASDLNLDYEWEDDIQYFADATDAGSPNAATNWTVSITAADTASASGSNTDTFEMGSLIALSVTASVNYGTVALGADSAEQTITFTDTGNRAIDADQTADGDMSCTGPGSSDIAVGAAHIATLTGFTYGTDDQALTTTATTVDMSLAQRTSEVTPSTDDWFAILRMPATGVGGTCTNTITFTAKADS